MGGRKSDTTVELEEALSEEKLHTTTQHCYKKKN
jgi:hypothetical protein